MLLLVKNRCAATIQLVLHIYIFVSLPQMQKPHESSRGSLGKILVLVTSELAESCKRFPGSLGGQHLRDSMCT